jgi:hypothetical protein
MLTVQAAIYSDYQNALAQHQAKFLDMVASHLLHHKLKQRSIIGNFIQMDWRFPANRLENGTCHSPDDDPDT